MASLPCCFVWLMSCLALSSPPSLPRGGHQETVQRPRISLREVDKLKVSQGHQEKLDGQAEGEMIRNNPVANAIRDAFRLDVPVVLSATPGDLLRVGIRMQDWTVGALARADYNLPNCKPMASEPSLLSTYQPHYMRQNFTMDEFLNAALSEPATVQRSKIDGQSGAHIGFTGRLHDWERHFYGFDAMSFFPPNSVESVEGQDEEEAADPAALFRQTHTWVGQAGYTTPLHHDYLHNSYIQLHGRKHFLLFPPSAHRRLHVRPNLHPAHRSSPLGDRIAREVCTLLMSDVEKAHCRDVQELCRLVVASQAAVEGAVCDQSAEQEAGEADACLNQSPAPKDQELDLSGMTAFYVTLKPGDILVLPALWFHHVTSLDFSMSVNVWTGWMGDILQGEIEQAILPIVPDQSPAQQLQVVRGYLLLLLHHLGLSGVEPSGFSSNQSAEEDFVDTAEELKNVGGVHGAKLFIDDFLLQSRYRSQPQHLVVTSLPSSDSQAAEAPDDSRYCHNQAEWDDATRDAWASRMLQSYINKMSRLFGKVKLQSGAVRVQILVADYVERIAHATVGATRVHQFLWDMANC